MGDTPLINLPDSAGMPNWSSMVQADGEDGDGEDNGGDLDLGTQDAADTPDAPKENRRRSPVHGHVSYLNFSVSRGTQLLFEARDERAKATGEWTEDLPEAERFSIWIDEIAGLDVSADEHRPESDRHYDFGSLFRGMGFKSLIVKTHMRGYEQKLAQHRRQMREDYKARLQKVLGAEWSDEQIEDLLGPDSSDN